MDLSVVIPTYNQADLLAECLRSFQHQTLPPHTFEIIVVDDGSTDHTPATLREFTAPPLGVIGIRFPDNRGRSAARNAGIARASAPLVAFVDSDVIVRDDFLEWHVRTHRAHGPRILSRGPVIMTSDARVARQGPIPRFSASPAYLDTANVVIPHAALVEAGLFDEGFPGYGWEDFELGMRLKRLGIRRIFTRLAVAFHLQVPLRWEGVDHLLRKEEERARSAVYFYQKHPTLETRILIQATPFHRALYWVQAAGGILTPHNVIAVTQKLRKLGAPSLAFLGLRGVLNRHYIHRLGAEFKRHAAALA